MTSTKTSTPIPCVNGVRDPIGQTRNTVNHQHRHCHSPTIWINGHKEVQEHLSDSDVDGLDTVSSVLPKQHRLPLKNVETATDADDSLMNWLMQQFQQNDIQGIQQSSRKQQKHDSGFRNSDTPIQKGDSLSVTQSSELYERLPCNRTKGDRWAKSCSRIDRVKPGNDLHYPRMPRSREASLRRKPKNPVDSMNQLLDEINRKAQCLKCENDRIKQELEKASVIIGDLKQARNHGGNQPERWATSTTALPTQSRYDTGCTKQNPVLRLKRLNNTKMNSSQCLLTRSAYPDTASNGLDRSISNLNEVRTPTVNRLRSDHRFVLDDRLPQSPPPSWNGTVPRHDVRIREKIAHFPYPIARRYSTTQQLEPIGPRDGYRESSLGPLTSDCQHNGSENGVNNTTGVTSKFSWIGRALSQLSLSDWAARPRCDSKPEPKRMDSAVPEIYERLSPPINGSKNLSTMIRRPFRRKATTPGPSPALYSPNASFDEATPANRCLSLMHLNGPNGVTYDESDRGQGRIGQSAQSDGDRRSNISFTRKLSHDHSMERVNHQDGMQSKDRSSSRARYNGLPKLWRKRETDVDPVSNSLETGWRH
ncbi:hypothetical protein D915_003835 [Fasciola hepatica]|uniref:Uncharacterized protein n=1 Tax=Fasciola hepatica TaxID=6192 RepID=A0A4E0S091_FASHE|nr:hypothetical protein D915_003835 [Fasciola hepatica]